LTPDLGLLELVSQHLHLLSQPRHLERVRTQQKVGQRLAAVNGRLPVLPSLLLLLLGEPSLLLQTGAKVIKLFRAVIYI
jgi:hypothetical protein